MQEKEKSNLPNVELNRRLALEKELDRLPDTMRLESLLYDESGNFLLYATPLGIRVLNLTTNCVVRTIGKAETLRFLQVSLCNAVPSTSVTRGESASRTAEMVASDNPTLQRRSCLLPSCSALQSAF